MEVPAPEPRHERDDHRIHAIYHRVEAVPALLSGRDPLLHPASIRRQHHCIIRREPQVDGFYLFS
jgi:hypothetical protein